MNWLRETLNMFMSQMPGGVLFSFQKSFQKGGSQYNLFVTRWLEPHCYLQPLWIEGIREKRKEMEGERFPSLVWMSKAVREEEIWRES